MDLQVLGTGFTNRANRCYSYHWSRYLSSKWKKTTDLKRTYLNAWGDGRNITKIWTRRARLEINQNYRNMFQLSINVTLHYSNHMHDHSHRGRSTDLERNENEMLNIRNVTLRPRQWTEFKIVGKVGSYLPIDQTTDDCVQLRAAREPLCGTKIVKGQRRRSHTSDGFTSLSTNHFRVSYSHPAVGRVYYLN